MQCASLQNETRTGVCLSDDRTGLTAGSLRVCVVAVSGEGGDGGTAGLSVQQDGQGLRGVTGMT